jgi:hypothetical protein
LIYNKSLGYSYTMRPLIKIKKWYAHQFKGTIHRW